MDSLVNGQPVQWVQYECGMPILYGFTFVLAKEYWAICSLCKSFIVIPIWSKLQKRWMEPSISYWYEKSVRHSSLADYANILYMKVNWFE